MNSRPLHCENTLEHRQKACSPRGLSLFYTLRQSLQAVARISRLSRGIAVSRSANPVITGFVPEASWRMIRQQRLRADSDSLERRRLSAGRWGYPCNFAAKAAAANPRSHLWGAWRSHPPLPLGRPDELPNEPIRLFVCVRFSGRILVISFSVPSLGLLKAHRRQRKGPSERLPSPGRDGDLVGLHSADQLLAAVGWRVHNECLRTVDALWGFRSAHFPPSLTDQRKGLTK